MKLQNITRLKPMNISHETDENPEEYNIDKYIKLYV
jgi:hypothetical protein